MIWKWKRPTAFLLAAAMIVTMSGVSASAVGPDGSAASGGAPAECSCETHCEQGAVAIPTVRSALRKMQTSLPAREQSRQRP